MALREIRSVNLGIGRHISIRNGKLSSNDIGEAQLLKLPLFPDGPDVKYHLPLPVSLPNGSQKFEWLTNPMPNNYFNPLTLARSPEVMQIYPYESDGKVTVWHVTTALIYTDSGPVNQSKSKVLELGKGITITLSMFHRLIRCTKCQMLDHTKNMCKVTHNTCTFCAEQHDTQSCQNKSSTRCARCNGPHKSSDSSCPDIVRKITSFNHPTIKKFKAELANSVEVKQSKSNEADHNNKTCSSPTQEVQPLLAVNFSSEQVFRLFPPSQYGRIADKLFPKLYRTIYNVVIDQVYSSILSRIPAVADPSPTNTHKGRLNSLDNNGNGSSLPLINNYIPPPGDIHSRLRRIAEEDTESVYSFNKGFRGNNLSNIQLSLLRFSGQYREQEHKRVKYKA